jgi:transposase, IS30 family
MRHYHHLSNAERATIIALSKTGHSIASIARFIKRSKSTVSRELRRNACNDGRYRVEKAQLKAKSRRRISRRNLRLTADQWNEVKRYLKMKWSPEQIVGHLRRRGMKFISHEMIYQRLYADKKAGGNLYLCLRNSKKKRRKRNGSIDRRGRLVGKRSIEDRPAEVSSRLTIGHWEGDTIYLRNAACLVSLVERKSGFTLVRRLRTRTKEETTNAIIEALTPYRHLCKTITFDNGCEFHGYKDIESAIGTTVYFAHPHSPHERGTNENTNGLIRQYAPRRATLFQLSQHYCNQFANELNDRPRKRLNYLSPSEVFLQQSSVALQS